MLDSKGHPVQGSVAWDWQFVVREPQVNTTYNFTARCVYKPFVGREDVLNTYRDWAATQ